MGKIHLPDRTVLSYPFSALEQGTWFVTAGYESSALYCKVNCQINQNAFEIVNASGEIGTCRIVNVVGNSPCIIVAPNITITGTMA